MQEVASDDGMAPVVGKAKKRTSDVGGLIAAVESKMAELMAWHAQQVRQLETDKVVLEAQADQQREALDAKAGELDTQREQLSDRVDQVNQQRAKLVELTSKLRAEESALSREWAEVQRERESIQQQAAELSEQRQRVNDRAKGWLDQAAADLSTPLKLTESASDEDADRQAA